ncbi:hypothetical protein HMPREF1987_00808 [Peptostreptococcaceae bacterium oral taxon 113 str. W5053]|nr:hypothetical protein HMPREF1987_00808 [Peptostreptococcaceae bacterium oral taxon 113 str. W5053]
MFLQAALFNDKKENEMKKTSIVVFIITLVAMLAINLLSNSLNFITYLVIVILPILFTAVYIVKEKNNGMTYSFGNSLIDTIIYTLIYAVGSYFAFISEGYKKILENSFNIGSQNIKIGSVEGLTATDLFLPFFVALIVFYLAGRKSQKDEEIK